MFTTAQRGVLALGFVAGLAGAPLAAHADGGCQFVLGFATLATALPDQVGGCVDNQAFAGNGDALQHTKGGLLVWRKADNWTAFTDGYHTWINGPSGLQERLNTDRFPWEAAAPPPAAPPSPAPAAAPAAAPATAGIPTSLPAEIAALQVPNGYPPYAALPPEGQSGCIHMAEDLAKAGNGPVTMHTDDQYCPYADEPTWKGFA